MKRYILAVLLLCACASAQENPLRKPVWELGPWFGGGTGLGHASDFKFLNAGVRIGRVLTGEIGDGKYRGTFEWASDIMPLCWRPRTSCRNRAAERPGELSFMR